MERRKEDLPGQNERKYKYVPGIGDQKMREGMNYCRSSIWLESEKWGVGRQKPDHKGPCELC